MTARAAANLRRAKRNIEPGIVTSGEVLRLYATAAGRRQFTRN
jgi:hypothetical protein